MRTAGASTATPRRMSPAAAFACVVFAFAVVMLGTTLPTPMYAVYSAELHFSVLTTTVIYATYAIGVIAALIGFGRWSDTLGRRPMLLFGIACAAASAIVFVTAGPVGQLMVGRLLSGLSAGIFAGTATAAVIEAAPPNWQSRAPAIATIANIGGLGCGPLVAGLLVQYAPWPLHLSFALHIVLLCLAIGGVLLVPETVDVQPGARPAMQRLSVPVEIRSLFVRASVAAFAGFAVLGLFTAVAPTFLAQVIGIGNHAAAGLLVFIIFAASALAQLWAGRMSTSTALISGCAALVVGMALIIVALSVTSAAVLVLGAVVAGIGQGVSFCRGLGGVAEGTPSEHRAEVTSTYFIVAYIAISIPVIGVGIAAQHWGLRTAGITFAALVAALAAAALIASAVAAKRFLR